LGLRGRICKIGGEILKYLCGEVKRIWSVDG
jgi:hypothetical protein